MKLTYIFRFFLNSFKSSSRFTSHELRIPHHFLHSYKSLQLVILEFNSFTRTYLLLYFNNVATILSVGGQIAIILLHHRFELESILYASIASTCATAYLIITYFKLGEINESSKKCIGSWKRNSGWKLGLGENDKKLLNKYVQSLQPCKIELGDFGFYQKQGSLRIIGKLVYYTTKGLMLLGESISS